MNVQLTDDWLVELGGSLCISHNPNELDHVEFTDGERQLLVYADAAFAVISIKSPVDRAAYARLMKTRDDFAQVCRLFQFKIDGLEGGQ
jgi:hypothetical protein